METKQCRQSDSRSCRTASGAQQCNTTPLYHQALYFLCEEGITVKVLQFKTKMKCNFSADDWQVRSALDGKGGFPEEILVTALRPDIIWSETGKEVLIGELTVPWEDSIDEAHERKLTNMAAEEGSSLLLEQPQKQQKQDHYGYGPSICRRADSLNVKYIMQIL